MMLVMEEEADCLVGPRQQASVLRVTAGVQLSQRSAKRWSAVLVEALVKFEPDEQRRAVLVRLVQFGERLVLSGLEQRDIGS